MESGRGGGRVEKSRRDIGLHNFRVAFRCTAAETKPVLMEGLGWSCTASVCIYSINPWLLEPRKLHVRDTGGHVTAQRLLWTEWHRRITVLEIPYTFIFASETPHVPM